MDGRELAAHRFGYVKVVAREDPATGVRVLETKTAGLWIDAGGLSAGIGMGFRSDRHELVPLDCRVVVRVAAETHLDAVVELFNVIGGEGICVVRN